MRIAFTATKAEHVVQRRRQLRKKQRRRPLEFFSSSCFGQVNEPTAGRLKWYYCSFCRRYQNIGRFGSHGRKVRLAQTDKPDQTDKPGQTDKKHSASSLLAIWHLTSVGFLFTTLIFSGIMTVSSSNDILPSTVDNRSIDHSTGVELVLDSTAGSCDRYEYYLSPRLSSTPTTPSPTSLQSVITKSIISSTSISDEPTKPSPSPSAANSAIDNIFSFWLRASRSSKAHQDKADLSPALFALSANHRARERYKYYFDGPDPDGLRSLSATTTKPIGAIFDAGVERNCSTIIGARKLPQCELFDKLRIDDLCRLDVSHRIKKLRHVYIRTSVFSSRTLITEGSNNSSFNDDASSPLTLYEFFNLTAHNDVDLLRPNVAHLSVEFRPCILSASEISWRSLDGEETSIWVRNSTTTSRCRTCYAKILERLEAVEVTKENFSISVLSMVDCEPDNFLEQFSPTSNCSECKIWYKRWLLIILTGLWKQKPCVQWCILAELACPHLSPLRKNDYAGLPSFRCKDPEIFTSWHSNASYGAPCDCLHPCDPWSPTFRWGWNVSDEKPEFCRGYRRQECGRNLIKDDVSNDRKNLGQLVSTTRSDRQRLRTTTELSNGSKSTSSSFHFWNIHFCMVLGFLRLTYFGVIR